jgi:CRP-like cAMP-binding protein
MVRHISRSTTNYLLRALSEQDAALLAPHLEPVSLRRGLVLERPHEQIGHVVFPQTAIASIIAHAGRGQHAEVGLYGRDGMSGIWIIMGNDRASHECLIQVAGTGLRIEAERLREAMRLSPTMRLKFLHFVHALLVQTGHTALANAKARLEQRLCRWLLMCHDRIDGDEMELTHEFLATMLAVRRSGVTTAIHLLEGRGLIRASRGRLAIIDRPGLEREAGSIYGAPEAEYRRLLGVSLSAR